MKAGRELDALIAEKVMGWKWCLYPKGEEWCKDQKLEGYWLDGTVTVLNTNEDGTPNCPDYSTNMLAAMRVVAAKKADIVEMVWHCDAQAWVVTFNDGHGPWAKTLAHAICLSALPTTQKDKSDG